MVKTTAAKVERTSMGLRDALFDEIDAIRSGNSSPAKANATARIASEIVNLARLELDVRKLMRDGAVTLADEMSLRLGSE